MTKRALLTGGSGFIGSVLKEELAKQGYSVFEITRSVTKTTDIFWDPLKGVAPRIDQPFEIVVNLAGENLGKIPWTESRKRSIYDSRIKGTTLLIEALRKSGSKPQVFISASAVGFYGDTADRIVSETSGPGQGFLADVCKDWEAAALQAERELGARVILARLGVVLGKEGGMLRQLLPIFRLCLGGRLGDGKQYLSWISHVDVIRGILFAISDPRLQGAVNFTAPGALTNAEFTKELAAAVHRPQFIPAPANVLRALLGKFAEEMLLKSIRVQPEKLLSHGFTFEKSEIRTVLNEL